MFLKVWKGFQHIIPYAILLGAFLLVSFHFTTRPAEAVAGVNSQLNFQGRLYNAAGALVPDGLYNIQFKIYQDGDGLTAGNTTGSPAGSLKWTESYLNTASQGIQVVNGFMSVQLGSINTFGTQVDWNQDTLWLSMNIGSTNGSCTPFTSCSPDGEMVPMKRLSATPYSLNSGQLNGLTSSNFVQLAQGVQTDSSTNTSSIFINKTSTGNLLQLQSSSSDVFTLTNSGDITFGSNANKTIGVATSAASTVGRSITVTGGTGGAGAGSIGGSLNLQGGTAGGTNANGGNVAIDAGAKTGTGTDGAIQIGTSRASTIQIGSTTLAGSQTIGLGNNNTAGSTTNVTIGSGASATAGTTAIQSKNNTTISTNGVVRGTFDTSGSLYLGNGVTATTPSAFTVSGTASGATAVTGGALSIQGGNATVGTANGGNLVLSGGTGSGSGVNGLVVFNTPTFSTTANDANCYTGGSLVSNDCTFASSSVNSTAAVIAGFNVLGKTATLQDPTILTAGRILYITAANGSSDFTLSVNGGGTGNTISMRQNTSATMIWNGTDWTAAGASSSTTLQSAYDNTLQSAGGAELIVSKTSTTNGLTIRDSSTNSVNGTLLSVQSASAAGLFSVNSNVTEYVSDAGAEVAGGSPSTFPASTWSGVGSASVSRYTTAGNFVNTGVASVSTVTSTSANDGVKNTLTSALNANTNYNVSFTTRLSSGSFTDLNVYYSVNGTSASVACNSGTAVTTSVWTKVNCTFTAPSSGITAGNAILIRQTASGTARTFYVDNLSVTIAADFNYATDGGVDDSTNFATNWSAVSSTLTRSISVGNDASDSAQVVTTAAAGQGVRNKLSVSPLTNTLYRISVYSASTTSGLNGFTIRYSRDGGTNFTSCADYNKQAISSSITSFTQVTCYITTDGTAPTNPYVYFTQNDAVARTFYVDTFSMTLSTSTTPNVQIGGGVNGGPTTLFTLDRGASAPIASNNDALLGSMYYDTTLGKLQCYESDGWGACGSSPDNVITISPEYTNAVLHGTGIGTVTSDICSSTLNINNGTSGQPTICGSNETYNFYKWTSPQATPQTYSIYVTYQLPGSFKTFASGKTSIMGRTDNVNSTVQYQVYRNNPALGLVSCGSVVTVSTGSVSSWQTGLASGAADPSTCGFTGSDSIVFKINVVSSVNANAYVGNLNFIFSNK